MLATLIIGLREGLEAALIVGIIAAFLRKNGRSLTAMWIGVALAVALSIAVGIALSWVEQDLPQAQQEGMESVIGAIAVCFVTGMILWMNTHARDMKRQLETEAASALGGAGLFALASMAFLAVLKEGFETSVFLLATFSAAQSTAWAAAGAVTGLLLAVAIGWGIYAGGVRINLSRFFRATGAFLVLVAAGLVVTALRTAHEAGWLNAGQQLVMDLSWLVAPGTVRSALLTGVLGIPADPRLVEGIGWLAYMIPVSLLIFWPASRRPGAAAAVRWRAAGAATSVVLAGLLAVLYAEPQTRLPRLSAAAQAAVPAAAPVQKGGSRIAITLTGGDHGETCALDHAAAQAGPITFTVTNQTATGLTEVELLSDNRILGEKENLAPGLPPGSFTLTLGGGAYQIYCPGAQQEMLSFTVTGQSAAEATGETAALLTDGTRQYANYVDGVMDAMVTAVGRLKTDIDAGDLGKARADYPLARPFYERIESDVDGFVLPGFKATDNAGNLDYLLDMRASNLDPKVGWHGFHAIERDLFKDVRITSGTRQLAAELQANVKRLDKLVKTLDYRPEDLANGAAELLEEVQTTKITGEEEAFSHYDLVDFAGNVEGARQAFAFLEPGLEHIDRALTQRLNDRFAAVDALLEGYRDPNEPGGFKRYTADIKTADAAKLSRAVQALQEPLSKIAEKVATAGLG